MKTLVFALMLSLSSKSLCFSQSSHRNFFDTTKAFLAKHREYKGKEVIAQLGYIDSSIVTLEEFRSNLNLGLVVLPSGKYEVASFSIMVWPNQRDGVGPYYFSGSRLPLRDHNTKELLSAINRNSMFVIENIRVKPRNENITYPVRPVRFTIVD